MHGGDYPGKGQSTASLVLGIIAIVFTSIGLIPAIIGLIMGINGKKKAIEARAPTGIAQAGIVLSIIALILNVLVVISCIACLASLDSWYLDDIFYYY